MGNQSMQSILRRTRTGEEHNFWRGREAAGKPEQAEHTNETYREEERQAGKPEHAEHTNETY